MFQDFDGKYPKLVSSEFYRRKVKEENISFCRLREEECEVCLLFNSHDVDTEENTVDGLIYLSGCETCDENQVHKKNSEITRKEYQEDKEGNFDPITACFAVDMQKVVMLPVMTGVKSCIFTRHLTTYHESIAPLGGEQVSKEKPTGVIWHDIRAK